MSYSTAYLTGLLLALMVSFNGLLSNSTSAYFSSFVFNAIGLICFSLLLLTPLNRKQRDPKKQRVIWLLIPGFLGAITILLSNATVVQLGVTLMVGISLLGQVITSLFVDGLGLMGKEKVKISYKQLIGIAIMFVGVALLL